MIWDSGWNSKHGAPSYVVAQSNQGPGANIEDEWHSVKDSGKGTETNFRSEPTQVVLDKIRNQSLDVWSLASA